MGTTYIRRNSEDTEQETVIRWARLSSGKWPELALLYHIPNGGSRNKKEAVKLKRMGVLAGVADLHLPVSSGRYHSLYIEMKYADGRVSEAQSVFLSAAAAQGNYCIVCYSAADAIEAITAYLSELYKYSNLSVIKHGRVVGMIK